MNTKYIGLLMAAYILIPHTASARENSPALEFSANAAIVSDYVFRGISQSDENFAMQGGFDVAHESGLYTGLWASGVDFNDNDEANIEVDVYAGYGGEIDNVSYDVGALYYAYPSANDSLNYDFWEVYGSLGYDFGMVNTTVGLNYSPEYFGDSGDALYTHFDIEAPLPNNFTLSAGIGHQSIDDNAAFGVPDYTDWNVALGYDWDKFNVSLTYHDTDLDEPSDCADGCAARAVFAISASF